MPFFEYYLTFPIMSKKYYGSDDFKNTPKNSAPVTSGRYKISDVQSSVITLEKNKNWWNAEKIGLSLENIHVNLYSSVGELYNSFKTGNIGCVGVIPEMRCKGIGLSMVAKAAELIKSKGCKSSSTFRPI